MRELSRIFPSRYNAQAQAQQLMKRRKPAYMLADPQDVQLQHHSQQVPVMWLPGQPSRIRYAGSRRRPRPLAHMPGVARPTPDQRGGSARESVSNLSCAHVRGKSTGRARPVGRRLGWRCGWAQIGAAGTAERGCRCVYLAVWTGLEHRPRAGQAMQVSDLFRTCYLRTAVNGLEGCKKRRRITTPPHRHAYPS